MKRLALIVASLAMPLFSAPALAQQAAPAQSNPANMPGSTVVATINGKAITAAEVMVYYETLPQRYHQVPIEKIYGQIVERVIDQHLLADAARKAGIAKRDDVKMRIANMTDGLLQEAYLQERIAPQISEEKLRAEYKKRIANAPKREEIHARHILVDTEAQAKEIIAEYQKTKDFVGLAKKHSKGPSAANGGDLGFFARESMVPEFADAAFAMKDGEVSKTPVRTQFGWHIIKVEGRRQAPAKSFEEMAGELRQEIGQAAFNKIIDGLRAGAKVTNKAK